MPAVLVARVVSLVLAVVVGAIGTLSVPAATAPPGGPPPAADGVPSLPPPPPAPPLPAGRIVDYTPAGVGPDARTPPDAAALAADAADLARLGVRTIVLARATPHLAGVCAVFGAHGIAVVAGVARPDEIEAALASRACVAGFVVTTGGAAAERAALAADVARLRREGQRPVAIRAPLAALRADATLFARADWVLATIRPYDAEHPHPQDACGWTLAEARALVEAAGGTPVVVDTGLPTAGGEMANEHYQRAFFACIESRGLRFSFHEAIDQPWRGGPTAAHYGLFRADGTPKRLAFQELEPRLSLRAHRGWLRGRARGLDATRLQVVVWVRDGDGPWLPRHPLPLGRDGKWHAPAPVTGAVAATLVAPGWAPAEPAARLPEADGERVFAVVEP